VARDEYGHATDQSGTRAAATTALVEKVGYKVF